MGTVSGRPALVAGGGSGIGRSVAIVLARAGSDVHVAGRTRTTLEETAGAASGITPHVCDVRDPASIEALASAVGEVSILVNAAGVIGVGRIDEITPEVFADVVATNLFGAFLLCRTFLPSLTRGPIGDVVHVNSIATERSFPGLAAYAASKAGLSALGGVLREETRGTGLRILDLVLGATDTAIWDRLAPDADRRRMIEPSDVARAILNALEADGRASVESMILRPRGGDL